MRITMYRLRVWAASTLKDLLIHPGDGGEEPVGHSNEAGHPGQDAEVGDRHLVERCRQVVDHLVIERSFIRGMHERGKHLGHRT